MNPLPLFEVLKKYFETHGKTLLAHVLTAILAALAGGGIVAPMCCQDEKCECCKPGPDGEPAECCPADCCAKDKVSDKISAKRIEAEEIVVGKFGSKFNVEIKATDAYSGIWIHGKDGRTITLMDFEHYAFVGIHPDNKTRKKSLNNACAAAMAVDNDGAGTMQLIDKNGKLGIFGRKNLAKGEVKGGLAFEPIISLPGKNGKMSAVTYHGGSVK